MNFYDAVSHFVPVRADEVAKELALGEDLVLFVGRATCPYCQRFAPKLAEVALEKGVRVRYLNSEDANDFSAITAFRAQYQMPTVPSLLVARAGQVKVVSDSSLTKEAIADFILS